MVDRRASAYRVLASDKRVAMLHLLQRTGGPMTVDTLADEVGLHVNTAREHLDQLVASGFVAREPELRRTRGRPRILYRSLERAAAVTTDAWAREQLVHVLVAGYGRRLGSAESAAETAGRAWGATLTPSLPDEGSADDRGPGSDVPRCTDFVTEGAAKAVAAPLERVQLAALEQHLEDLGFAPDACTDGLEVQLNRCPFVDLARERPEVVCSVHLGLSRGVLAQQDGPLVADRLERVAGAQRCVLHLSRRAAAQADAPIAAQRGDEPVAPANATAPVAEVVPARA
ncbi:metalloregulator ArsR/SmtB family transcription factor [Cellulomonas cellasea]|uniref:Putative ArsR family transcriptional regulator n=1 Tax=Cellulomonas cellasea TaxID=43670 RepID=A0A7W4YBU0_9CELL|nr:helix-turn-helix domain-containing protein [Cellulomonas cellasea]MBB2922826.1 putative ArsR family transcriptional regulator [Cellulomonas cellasea]